MFHTYRYFILEQINPAFIELIQRQAELRETIDQIRSTFRIWISFHALQIDIWCVIRFIRQCDINQHPIFRAMHFVRVWNQEGIQEG